ncbi:hypothetical protein AEAC466_10735 [Asticcacaulis sp. AC466]|nr:hypothetical protein AEAC466_10735 [Asticcacaulis sp. AC466]
MAEARVRLVLKRVISLELGLHALGLGACGAKVDDVLRFNFGHGRYFQVVKSYAGDELSAG